MPNEHFKIGTEVALITHGWGVSLGKRTVTKVRKDGKFFVSIRNDAGELTQLDQMWTPDRFGRPQADMSGSGHYPRESMEVWSDKHDGLLRELRERNTARKARDDLLSRIKELSLENEEHRNLIINLCALLPEQK